MTATKQVFFGRHPAKLYAFVEQWRQPHLFIVVFGFTRFDCSLLGFLGRVIFGAGK